MGARSEVAWKRRICDDGSALTQGFFVASLRAKTSSTNGSNRVIRSIFMGALADAIFDGCAGTTIEEIYDKVRRKCSVLCDGRAEQIAHAEFAVEPLRSRWKSEPLDRSATSQNPRDYVLGPTLNAQILPPNWAECEQGNPKSVSLLRAPGEFGSCVDAV
jgi:hypothetical protein